MTKVPEHLNRVIEYVMENFTGDISASSVQTDSAMIGGYPSANSVSQSTFGDISIERGSVTVAAGDYHTIFDVDPDTVDVIGGSVIGPAVDRLRFTWSDGSEDVFNLGAESGDLNGSDGSFTHFPISQTKGVSKLEFRNRLSDDVTYGFRVFTL